ncbi:small ribosomal subunit Rsm22 family protein [Phenylobacterium sp.]|uniref:small ribosomal subunit Rsm22 family protein n=1 Tax=Phenylobacterium sp. TaxID=1871053 RepID=UPI003784BE5C
MITGLEDALAYSLARLPGTYAACLRAFAEAAAVAPAFSPRTMLDAGSGPAAASWAALATWGAIAEVAWLDSSAPFLDLAGRLAADGPPQLRASRRTRADLTADADLPAADLVVASYALAEIAPAALGPLVDRLWRATAGVLVLVEPGTPAGFSRLRTARAALTTAGGGLLAPCPHEGACPIAGSDWCHFRVRVPRSRDHRLAKGADAPFEDEKFAYLAVARPAVAVGPRHTRILTPPKTAKPGIEFRVCTPEGIAPRFIPRRDKPAHAQARRLDWGDVLP